MILGCPKNPEEWSGVIPNFLGHTNGFLGLIVGISLKNMVNFRDFPVFKSCFPNFLHVFVWCFQVGELRELSSWDSLDSKDLLVH